MYCVPARTLPPLRELELRYLISIIGKLAVEQCNGKLLDHFPATEVIERKTGTRLQSKQVQWFQRFEVAPPLDAFVPVYLDGLEKERRSGM